MPTKPPKQTRPILRSLTTRTSLAHSYLRAMLRAATATTWTPQAAASRAFAYADAVLEENDREVDAFEAERLDAREKSGR